MTRPSRYVVRMIFFLGVVAAAVTPLYPTIRDAFLVNVALNGLIVAVLGLGILYSIGQVLMLGREVRWLAQFEAAQAGRPSGRRRARPRLLAPMARMLGDPTDRVSLSALSMRSLLDGIAARLDESREQSRYLVGLLIFLGLLGTFWGLLQTVRSVGDVIGGLSLAGSDASLMFGDLQRGLEAPLAGMGTAFSSSLFGLAGSLVLGFLDLQASQAQHRFYQDVEDQLSSVTRLSSAAGPPEGEPAGPAYLHALLAQTAETLEAVARTTGAAEEGRRAANANLLALTDRLGLLTEQMRADQSLMIRVAESLADLKPLIAKLADAAAAGGFGIDDRARDHLRSIDLTLARGLEDLAGARGQALQDLRGDIRLVARTIAALAEEVEPAAPAPSPPPSPPRAPTPPPRRPVLRT